MSAFGSTTFGSAPTQPHNPNKDAELVSPPDDGISSLSWSPMANHLIVTSWDNTVRCYNVAPAQGAQPPQSQGVAMQRHSQPVLCSAWMPDGSKVLSAGCDNEVKLWDLGSNQQTTVGRHDGGIRHVRVVAMGGQPIAVTGSWDKTLRYWDLRQPSPVHQQPLQERCYALDARGPLLVVGTANRRIQVFNLQQPQTVYKELESPLKFQTRCITCFPDSVGFMVGSIEGRVAVQHIEAAASAKSDFTFKCHRDGSDVYSVNAIDFHPVHGSFVTVGSDGTYNFWDKDSKQRLKAMTRGSLPISSCAFDRTGQCLAYAASYDWSEGHAKYVPGQTKNYVLLHTPVEAEVGKRPKPTSTRR